MNYPKPDSHISEKVKVVLYLSDYATKKQLKDGTLVDISNLAAKRDFIALKVDTDKLDINEFVNVSTCLNTLKAKVDDLNVDKLKIVIMDLKKLSDVMSKEIVIITKFNKLNTKVSNLENKIPDATTVIHINQYNIDKQG